MSVLRSAMKPDTLHLEKVTRSVPLHRLSCHQRSEAIIRPAFLSTLISNFELLGLFKSQLSLL